MKKLILPIFLMAVLLFASCSKNSKDDPNGIGGDSVPSLNITVKDGQLRLKPELMEGSFSFEILNGDGSGEYEVVIPDDAEWISNPKVEVFDVTGLVTFDVSPNWCAEERSAILKLVGHYADDATVQTVVNVTQDYYKPTYEYAPELLASNYLGKWDNGSYLSTIWMGTPDLSFQNPDGLYGTITLYQKKEPQADCKPQAGTYIFGKDAELSVGSGQFFYFPQGISAQAIEGGLTITDKGNDKYNISGMFKDQSGCYHSVFYEGILMVIDHTK